ncbi:trypsin-like peptidase domain-containing protein [Streptomyces sp. NPDC057099]|uniref:trypsin-like peptidase domain-containing protein n=1 Tax=Streptomyces sp. NPDC057099 TaxID=3346019 RepID=UPI00363EC025
MNTGEAREVFKSYAAALAYVEVESPTGDLSIGTAFHVGEGVFVTARHVVEGKKVVEVGSTESVHIPLTGAEAVNATTFLYVNDERMAVHWVRNGVMRIESGPYLHSDERVDVAVFKVHAIDPRTPVIPLGSHLDDWLGGSDFVLTEAVILGYPPIPMTTTPALVGARAEISAQVDLYETPYVHFVLSATARGGFSGGVAFSEYGFALGMVTRSLLAGEGSVESGYMAVLAVEPIYECLAWHRMLPDCQAEMWDGLWNTSEFSFSSDEPVSGEPSRVTAQIAIFDDGKTCGMTITCGDGCSDRDNIFPEMLRVARSRLSNIYFSFSLMRLGYCKIDFKGNYSEVAPRVYAAAQSVGALLVRRGYFPLGFADESDIRPESGLDFA